MQLIINERSSIPKYRQIVDAVVHGIEMGILRRDEQLPSINELSGEYDLARDTVEKAYKLLKKEGIIHAVRGKGYFIRQEGTDQLRVLLLINKLSAYKKIVYYALLDALGPGAVVDLRLHHHSVSQLEHLLQESKGLYNYYVVMPHFYDNDHTNGERHAKARALLAEIPPEKLVLLDKNMPDLKGDYIAVYQEFDRDIYAALESGADLLEKYQKLVLVFPRYARYPDGIVSGFRNYAVHYQKDFAILETIMNHTVDPNTAYLILEDSDLAELVRQARRLGLRLGKEIGVLSFNETPLKEVLADGITVVSTDHELMGQTAAQLMLRHRAEKVKNPSKLIRRSSL